MTATYLPSIVPPLRLPVLDINFTAIDWQAPWLCHLNQLDYLSKAIKRLSGGNDKNEQQVDTLTNKDEPVDIIAKVLNTALKQQSESLETLMLMTKPTSDNQAHPLKFVSQSALPEGLGYEQFIGTTGNIPTRDNLHDLFNGSIWLTFPKTKALLNYYHMLEIGKSINEQNNQKIRGRVRDTITVFDENGAILVTTDPSIGEALINFDWQASLVTPRDKWDNPKLYNKERPNKNTQAAVYIFGHALLEQLIQPRKSLCAHSVVINVEQDFFALPSTKRMIYLDDKLAEHMDNLLSKDTVTPRQLAPLPILGIPHFWSENADHNFYDDRYVFRSGRQRKR